MLNITQGRNRGSVLIITLIFSALLALAMMPALSFLGNSTRMAHSTRAMDQAFYAAEAGIARALSFVFGEGGGAATGIYSPNFDVDENNAYYPFGQNWISLDEGINTASGNDRAAMRVEIWKDAINPIWHIRSTGRTLNPRPLYRTITVDISIGSFSRYAFYADAHLTAINGGPIWLKSGETFNGVVHSNHHLWCHGLGGDPLVFNSDVTIYGEDVNYSEATNVVYNALKDTDAEIIELPSDLSRLTDAGNDGGLSLPLDDPWTTGAPGTYVDPVPNINNYRFVFNSNGTVTVTNVDAQTWAGSSGNPYSPMTVDLSSINGAIVVYNGNAFVSGTVNGRATIAALSNDANTNLIGYKTNVRTDGNVIIENNIIYESHPLDSGGGYDLSDSRDFSGVDDALGLIAERYMALDGSMPSTAIIDAHLMMTGQSSPNPDITTWNQSTDPFYQHGVAVGQDGAFYVEDGLRRDLSERWTGVSDNEPGNGNRIWGWVKTGTIYLTGGMVQFIRGLNGYFNSSTGSMLYGFDRNYNFDSRFMTTPPPYYPLIPDLVVVGWKDVSSTSDNYS
jgi:hypothetical protein